MANLTEKPDKIEDNPLVLISSMRNDIVAYTGDERYGEILDIATRLISGEFPNDDAKLKMLIIKLEAMAINFRMQYVSFMGMYKGTKDANMKKNFARSMYEGLNDLAAALKYMVK